MQTYKIFMRQWIYNHNFLGFCDRYKTSYKAFEIFMQYFQTKLRKNSSSWRVAPLWNSLENNLKCAPNITSFKMKLD